MTTATLTNCQALGLFAALHVKTGMGTYAEGLENACDCTDVYTCHEIEKEMLAALTDDQRLLTPLDYFESVGFCQGLADKMVDRFSAWQFDQAPVESISDTINAAYPFRVDLKQLAGPDGTKTPHYGLFRDDTGQPVGNAFKQGYQPHQTTDVVALAEAASDAFGADCKVACHWSNGHKVIVSPSDDHRLTIYKPGGGGGGDSVFPRLIISAGYDGRAFSGTLGLFRDVCQNLQIARLVSGHVEKIKHTSSLVTRLDDLRLTFSNLAARWDHAKDVLETLEATAVNLADFLAAVYPQADDAGKASCKSHATRVVKIFDRFASERRRAGRPEIGNDYQVTAYEAYQAVNGYEIWDKPRRKKLSNPEKIFQSFDSKPSQHAEQLAMELAGV